jgi:hypothetical protein
MARTIAARELKCTPPDRLLITGLRRGGFSHHPLARVEWLPRCIGPAIEAQDADRQSFEPVRRLEERVKVTEAHHQREHTAQSHQAPREPLPQQ